MPTGKSNSSDALIPGQVSCMHGNGEIDGYAALRWVLATSSVERGRGPGESGRGHLSIDDNLVVAPSEVPKFCSGSFPIMMPSLPSSCRTGN